MWILNIVVLLLGILFVCVGGFALFFLHAARPLNYAEIRDMKQAGKFEDEPDYMQDFRVTRAAFDLEWHQRWTRYIWFVFLTGFCLVGVALVLWLCSWVASW
jgi:hypothetical protein